MHRRKNWLFSNWKRRMVNIVKGRRSKREKRFASYSGHYFVVNGILGFYAYFYLNPMTIIFYLLFITIFLYILIFLNTCIHSYVAYTNKPKIPLLIILIQASIEVVEEEEELKINRIMPIWVGALVGWISSRELVKFFVHMMTTFLISITPKNVHPLMAFILIPVELISVIIRPVSLAIRMFANLAMGHVMIAGFKFATAYPCGGWWGWFCATTTASSYLILFEFVVLILQSAIFLYLVTTYFWGTNEVH